MYLTVTAGLDSIGASELIILHLEYNHIQLTFRNGERVILSQLVLSCSFTVPLSKALKGPYFTCSFYLYFTFILWFYAANILEGTLEGNKNEPDQIILSCDIVSCVSYCEC